MLFAVLLPEVSAPRTVRVHRRIEPAILYVSYMIDRRLRVLQAIARHGTVTAAAEVCRLTPSAASHQIQALSRELDVTLLESVGRGVRLTPAARTLLAHGTTLAAQWEHAQADLAAHRAGDVGGTLRFCGFSTAAAVVVPGALHHLRRKHPALRVHLRECEPARSFDLLASDDTDIAVVVATPDIPPVTDAAFDQYALYDEPLDILVGPDHPLIGHGDVALSDLAAEPWICGNPGRAYHQLVTLACASAGFAPDIAHYADEWDTGAAPHAASGWLWSRAWPTSPPVTTRDESRSAPHRCRSAT
jgi:DNA-binding transcriptional LysR family regulator